MCYNEGAILYIGKKKVREVIMVDLQSAVIVGTGQQLHELDELKSSMLLWIHDTSWNTGFFDMQRLLDEDCLTLDATQQYKPDGTWRDRFAPVAFRLTDKGYQILTNRSQWVFEGTFNKKKKKG